MVTHFSFLRPLFMVRAAVLCMLVFGLVLCVSAQDRLNSVSGNNTQGMYSAVGSDGSRYLIDPGSADIRVLDSFGNAVRTLRAHDALNHAVPLYAIHVDPASGTLVVADDRSPNAALFAVDLSSGLVTARGFASGNIRQSLDRATHMRMLPGVTAERTARQEMASRLPASAPVLTVEHRSDQTWTPDPRKRDRDLNAPLDAVVARVCNGLVCAQIDEDGDFNFGTQDGQNLLFAYPDEPWSSNVIISVDGLHINLTSEAGSACDGVASFIGWSIGPDSISLHTVYMYGDIDIEVVHELVTFSATSAAVLTRTIVSNHGTTAHEVGVLYEYDTMVAGDDAAELYLGPNHLLNETCFDAPFAWDYWDAVPQSGALVGRGSFTGGEAVTPDALAFGRWSIFNNVCWNHTCVDVGYGDSAVLYRWNPLPLAPGAYRTVATYYGIGEITIAPGSLQLSVIQPSFRCDAGVLVPDPFNLLVNVTNTGGSICSNVEVYLTDGAGPGGNGYVISTNPVVIPSLDPGDNAAVNFTVNVPDPNAGCIYFDIHANPQYAEGSDASTLCDSNEVLDYCVELPECEPLPGFIDVDFAIPTFRCSTNVVVPQLFDLPLQVWNSGPGDCDSVSVGFSGGSGPGGTGVVLSPSPALLGHLSAGDTVATSFQISITPSDSGGCIFFSAFVSSSCQSYFIDFICFSIPACDTARCGCMDVVFAVDVTGSMGGAISSVITELPQIITSANSTTGGDLQLGLVTFHDVVHVLNNLTFDQAAVTANINTLFAYSGADEPEASDEALHEIINGGAFCTDGSEFTSLFRSECIKIIVLITDARPGGCDDAYTPGVDDVNAHSRALEAAASGVKIAAVYVPTWGDPFNQIVPVMQDYSLTTGGSYAEVAANGSGTAAAISGILDSCGTIELLPDDCLPEGPGCNSNAPVGYKTYSGGITDATILYEPDGHLLLSWNPDDDAAYYRVYAGTQFDAPSNYIPVGATFDTSLRLSVADLQVGGSSDRIYFYVQAKQAVQEVVAADLGCWPIDEGLGNVTFDMAQDNDGAIVGADWEAGPNGHWGLHFGPGDFVDVPNDVEFYGHPLQVDACVTIDSLPTVRTGSYYIFSCHRYATWFQGFGLRVDIQGRLLCEVWDQNINNWRTLWAPPSHPVPVGVPFLVTAVINGNDSMILLNGEIIVVGQQDYNSITNGFHMTIGSHNYNSNRHQYSMRGGIHWLKVSQY